MKSQTDDAHQNLLDLFAVLMDWRTLRPFVCEAMVQHGSEVSVHNVRVVPVLQSYEVLNRGTGNLDAYDSSTRIRISNGAEVPSTANQFHNEPWAVKLAFPSSLPIWGRRSDQYRLIGAERQAGELVGLLRHTDDGHLFGSITVDMALRQVTRIDLPGFTVRYSDIEAHTVDI